MNLGKNADAIERKKKILDLLAKGNNIGEIAAITGIIHKTIEQALGIMKKANNCKTTIQLVVMAIENKVI